MSLPKPVERLWNELEHVRGHLLREVEGLSQRQADFKPSDADWSVGEIVDHVTIAEIATGKLNSKLLKDVQAGSAAAVFPHDLTEFAAPPPFPAGPVEAPPAVQPGHGKPIGELLAAMGAARARTRESLDRLAGCDPRRLTFAHFRLGTLDLGQWWRLQAAHEASHLEQIREVKAAAGFPKA
ncbi:MAG TPA: DinB family protein [Methylomirabilota bacterium]|nr:DinB family protein [Methylomirabilota bacterium]